MRFRIAPATVVTHFAVILVALLTIFPLFWMVSTSFKAPNEIFTPGIRLIPRSPTMENYREAWLLESVPRWTLNSVVAAVGRATAQVLTGILAAYAFGRYRFKGRGFLFMLFLGTMLIPWQSTFLGNYVTVFRLGWLNTYQANIVPAMTDAFSVFLLRQYFLSFPPELFDSADMDGANSWQTLWRIVVPNIKAPLAALFVQRFLSAWNSYFWPLLVLQKPMTFTLPLVMQRFVDTEQGIDWGPMMAFATLASLPSLLVFVAARKHMIRSFVTSGIK